MRDFRNAKAMAQTLRAALAAKGVKITVSQSLELVAEMFGLDDWNTLVAAIGAEKTISREKVSHRRSWEAIRFHHFRPCLLRRSIGPLASQASEIMNTRHWSIFCSP